jgi:hypothetical protein
MIEKVVHKARLSEHDEVAQNLKFWLSKTPEERVAAIEFLRREHHGVLPRLQRVARFVQRSRS